MICLGCKERNIIIERDDTKFVNLKKLKKKKTQKGEIYSSWFNAATAITCKKSNYANYI